jgi:hypothetical protein
MGTPNFSPANIACGVVSPGQTANLSTTCGVLSATANVTAAISGDTSGGAITLVSVLSFITKTEIEFPDPGDLPPGVKPVGVKVNVAVQEGHSNGVTPLAVLSGQYIQVNVQFAPTVSTPDTSTATLTIQGDSWGGSVSIPITATMAELSISAASIQLAQGASQPIKVTVTSVHGAGTTVDLTLLAEADADVTATPATASFSLGKGQSVATTFTASAASTLTPGAYSRTVSLSAFGGAYSLSTALSITVVQPYYPIKSKLGNVIQITSSGVSASPQSGSGTDDQLWNFAPDPAGSGYYSIVNKNGDAIEIPGASQTAGVLLGVAKKTAADDQLWCFVADPGDSGEFFIVSKLNGNVIDIQGNASAAALDAFPVKPTGNNNQLWSVAGGAFPSTVSAALPPVGLGNGNVNYFLGGGGAALTGVSAVVDFTADFVSTAGGFSFQFNGYSTDPEPNKWQQFAIYATPGSSQLTATVQTWSGTAAGDWINNIHTSLANLPSSTIPKGYSFTIVLTYYNAGGDDGYSDPSALISGATFTVNDNTKKLVGTASIGILGQTTQSNQPATVANLAPLAALEFCIGGDYNFAVADVTSGAGTITYTAAEGLTASSSEPSYTDFDDPGTGENANVLFGQLLWPWTGSPNNQPALQIVQPFAAVTGGSTAAATKKRTHGLMPPPKL